MARVKCIVFLALAVAGCAAKEPGIEVRTVEVPVLRVEKCIAASDIPKQPDKLGRRPSNDARVLADLLLAKVLEWQTYGSKADPVLQRCASSES